MESRIVIAMYKPHEGKDHALLKLVKEHLPTLQKLELATKRKATLCKSEDGTLLEIFEWVDEESSSQAHQHPVVAKIWEQMGQICDFQTLDKLAERGKPFPNFIPA
ncbi:MAG: hypothetical protein HRU19_16135 [Pseudobacteriovorax sp.]|nr:hypothetical protein [Pseudobacteriovorax sp.]